uniref:Uncharacterized protein n=1 Tax=Triticum urartu TaxID=4572 RepID=A0A8R7JYV1_TRIUA
RHNRQLGFPPQPSSLRRWFFDEPPPTPPPSPLFPRVVDTHGVAAHPPRVREGVVVAVPLLDYRCHCCSYAKLGTTQARHTHPHRLQQVLFCLSCICNSVLVSLKGTVIFTTDSTHPCISLPAASYKLQHRWITSSLKHVHAHAAAHANFKPTKISYFSRITEVNHLTDT